jgi:hypothetical protein
MRRANSRVPREIIGGIASPPSLSFGFFPGDLW